MAAYGISIMCWFTSLLDHACFYIRDNMNDIQGNVPRLYRLGQNKSYSGRSRKHRARYESVKHLLMTISRAEEASQSGEIGRSHRISRSMSDHF